MPVGKRIAVVAAALAVLAWISAEGFSQRGGGRGGGGGGGRRCAVGVVAAAAGPAVAVA